MGLLKKQDLTDVMVFAGGIVPEEDIDEMKKLGIKEIFGPGTTTDAIIQYVRDNLPKKDQ
jgi:methylmalonyl-CoA mutase C-terminal domain/subunit